MNTCDECGEPHFFDYGDFVQLAQNRMVKGQVVGERSWGDEYNVRLIGLLKTEWFHSVELEPDEEIYGPALVKTPAGGEGAPAAPGSVTDNVIYHDFKRAGGVH